jgi:cytoskeleton protein RodZ
MTAGSEASEERRTAGTLLRQLRERKNLAIHEIAAQMRLDPRTIEALEADNYQQFAADTYIRGYLRAYAKLLGVSGDEIISLYASQAPPPPEIIPDVKHPTQVSSSDRPVKAFTYLITFLLALMLGIWWWQNHSMFHSTVKATAAQPTAAAPVSNPIAAPADIPAEILVAIPEPDTAAAPPTPGPADGTAQVGEESGSPVVSAIAAPSEPAAEDQAQPGPDAIFIRLNGDCWIDIRDRYDKTVYRDLARAGEELRLNGFAPFQVELGNAQGVIIEFNETPYDPAPVTTRGIARFILGQ